MKNKFEEQVQSLTVQFQALNPEDIERTISHAKSLMDEETRAEFNDLSKVALARIDRKTSIEYWLRNSENGQKIKLTELQCLILDFVDIVWGIGYIPIVNAPMGSGKTSLACAILAYEIGKNQNIRTQIVCAAEDTAIARGRAIGSIILSKDFRKVFPHIEKAKKKPWNDHKLNVTRTVFDPEAEEMEREQGLEPGTIDATLSAFGIDSKALGTRVDRALFDDIPNEDNAIVSPKEGDRISSKLDSSWISRKESPLGVDNTDYDITKDPYRGLFINTPWSEVDCAFRRIKLPRYATILVGVNADFTGYNVEIWNLPEDKADYLKNKYQMFVSQRDIDEDNFQLLQNKGYKVGDPVASYHVYKDFPAKSTFTIRLSRPAEWYLNEAKGNVKFNQMYRCMVVSERERAYPFFERNLDSSFKVYWQEVYGKNEDGATMVKGHIATVSNRPTGHPLYAAVDLSGVGRAGTVITCGALLSPDFRRMPIEIRIGSWSGDEISTQIGELFKKYPDLLTVFVENAGQQDIFIKEMLKHKDKYPWWMKIKTFKTTAKTKNDKQLGVMAMDTAFANRGFIIANSIEQTDKAHADNFYHPPQGDGKYPEGCPCGFCKLIRAAKTQLRLAKVENDSLMSLWMYHSSLPQVLDLPTVVGPDGMVAADSGAEYTSSLEESFEEGRNFLNSLFSESKQTNDPRLIKHFRENGSQIMELDNDWQDEWSDMYEEETIDTLTDKEIDGYNQPNHIKNQQQKTKIVSSWARLRW